MIDQVRDYLSIGDKNSIKSAYLLAFNEELKRVCDSSIGRARTKLEAWLKEHNAETPINIIEGKGKLFSELTFEPKAVNVISNGCFFDETLDKVREITGFSAYCLSNWKYENGNIELQDGIGAWVFYGVPKLIEDFPVNELKPDNLKCILLNPAFSIHAIGEKSGINNLPPYRF